MFKFIGKMTALLVMFTLILSFIIALVPVMLFIVPPVALVIWELKE